MLLLRRAAWVGTFIAMACMAAGASSVSRAQEATRAPAAATDSASVGAAADLGPTTAAPWNPPQPESGARLWETLLELPGRIVTLPLSALDYGVRDYLLFAEANNVVPRAIAVLASSPHIGVYAIPASLGDHTGTGVALEVRPPQLHGILSGELSASTQHYHRTRVLLAL